MEGIRFEVILEEYLTSPKTSLFYFLKVEEFEWGNVTFFFFF